MAMSLSFGGRSLTTRSPIWIVPPVISSSPAMERSAVDLPHPEGPTRTMNSPSLMSRLRSLMAWTPPGYAFSTWSRMICAMGAPLSEISVLVDLSRQHRHFRYGREDDITDNRYRPG